MVKLLQVQTPKFGGQNLNIVDVGEIDFVLVDSLVGAGLQIGALGARPLDICAEYGNPKHNKFGRLHVTSLYWETRIVDENSIDT